MPLEGDYIKRMFRISFRFVRAIAGNLKMLDFTSRCEGIIFPHNFRILDMIMATCKINLHAL